MKNWKHKQERFLWVARMYSEKADLVSIQFSMKLITKFNLETPFPFPDYVKASDRVKRNKLFEIL